MVAGWRAMREVHSLDKVFAMHEAGVAGQGQVFDELSWRF